MEETESAGFAIARGSAGTAGERRAGIGAPAEPLVHVLSATGTNVSP